MCLFWTVVKVISTGNKVASARNISQRRFLSLEMLAKHGFFNGMLSNNYVYPDNITTNDSIADKNIDFFCLKKCRS
jgi:hypothetical protein